MQGIVGNLQKIEPPMKRDLYYTQDHEWIDFQGTIAYIGICHFKLLGFKDIQNVVYEETFGFKKQGEPIAHIFYNDYQVQLHMPVDGKIISLNEELTGGSHAKLLEAAETSAWIAKIIPTQPYERKSLLLPSQYRMNGKSNYAK